jgi:hypothetical protein
VDIIIAETTTETTATSPISISQWIRDGIGIFRRHPWTILGGLFLFGMINGAVEITSNIPVWEYAGLLLILLLYPADVGWSILCLKGLRGERPGLADIFRFYGSFFPLMAVLILSLLLVFGGLAFFVVPGIVLLLKFMFAGVALVDRDLNVAGAFRFSNAITKGYKWKLFAIVILSIAPSFAFSLFSMIYDAWGFMPGFFSSPFTMPFETWFKVIDHLILAPLHPLHYFANGFLSEILYLLPAGILEAAAYDSLVRKYKSDQDNLQGEKNGVTASPKNALLSTPDP